MDCVGRNWPRAGPAQTPNRMEAPTHKPPASHRHLPLEREHSHSSSVFTGASCCSRSSTSAKLRAGGRGDGSGEWESSHVVSGDAVRQSPGSTPLGRSILSRRGDGVGRSGPRRRVDATLRRATGFCHAAFGVGLRLRSVCLRDSWRRPAGPRSPRIQRGRSRRILPICPRRPRTDAATAARERRRPEVLAEQPRAAGEAPVPLRALCR